MSCIYMYMHVGIYTCVRFYIDVCCCNMCCIMVYIFYIQMGIHMGTSKLLRVYIITVLSSFPMVLDSNAAKGAKQY